MEYTVRPYRRGEEEYVAQAHKRIYEQEYRWGPEFSDYAMKIARDFAEKTPEDGEELWIAEMDRIPVGSIMLCRTDDARTGQLRLFLVEKDARCKGIGSALMEALFEKARQHGYSKLVLWTASPLTDAIRQYEKTGFRETERAENNAWSLDGETVYEIKMETVLTHE